jgi:uncharacterized protein (DUF1501 family)
MTINRRNFIRNSTLASAAMLMPRFLTTLSATPLIKSEKILVVVQLSGGNDALNTIIPFRNDDYYRLRPRLGIRKEDVLNITDNAGLNPAMTGLRRLFNEGQLAIINNVGYPDPDRSHFRSMDIWQTGSASSEYLHTGWIGRYLDVNSETAKAFTAIETDDTLSLALKGQSLNGLAVKNPERLFRNLAQGYYADIAESYQTNGHHHKQADYLYKTLTETINSADYIYKTSKIYKSVKTYPNHEFSKNLKTIAELIISGSNTRIYYVSLSGFDTHIQQQPRQEQVLKILDEGLSAFTDDLSSNNRFDDVMIMAFSEFGRRASQNASQGTDHGKAGSLFLLSNSLKKKGMINELPDLSNLDDGDLKFNVDFRNIYATILEKWLNTNHRNVLNFDAELMNFI